MRALFLSSLLLLLLCRPCFPARILADSVTTVVQPAVSGEDDHEDARNATWHDFARFLDAGVGAQVSGMSELKRYFSRFGYLSLAESNLTDVFDGSLQSAVMKYQTNMGLNVTGRLDSRTITAIVSPRCGVGDDNVGQEQGGRHRIKATRRFTYFYGRPRWSRGSPAVLTYSFSPDHTVDYLDPSELRAAFRRAFSRWSAVIPVAFEEAEELQSADIKIGFYRGDHGDGEAFDGVLGVLAHAFSPENGRLHLDAAERWSVDFKAERSRAAVDLESVATHEIGHVLGLAHSSVKEAVMYPSLSPRTKKVELRIDDVEGVQALYGSNPNFKLSSLLESENASNHAGEIRSPAASMWWSTARSAAVVLALLSCV